MWTLELGVRAAAFTTTAVIGALAPSAAAAQRAEPPRFDSAAAAIRYAAEHDSYLRLGLRGGELVEGRLWWSDSTSLRLVGGEALRLRDLDSIALRTFDSDAVWTGMAVGAVVGLGLAAVCPIPYAPRDTCRGAAMAGWGLSGALWGFVIDTMIGNTPVWHPVWPGESAEPRAPRGRSRASRPDPLPAEH